MFAVSALIPSGSGLTLVTKVLGQVKADAPQLLAVLAGVVAIGLIIHLLLTFLGKTKTGREMHQYYAEMDADRRDFIEGNGRYADLNSDEVGDWAQFERDNYKALDDLDAEMKKTDRLMRDL